MPASTSKDPYLSKVFRGSLWPFGGLFPPPVFLGLLMFWELGRDAAGFNNSAACANAHATFTFPAMALRLGAEVLDPAPSVGTRSSELDPDPAPRVRVRCLGKHWVQHQETQNSCPLSTRTPTVPERRPKLALTSQTVSYTHLTLPTN